MSDDATITKGVSDDATIAKTTTTPKDTNDRPWLFKPGDPRVWRGGKGPIKRRAVEKLLAEHAEKAVAHIVNAVGDAPKEETPCPMCGRGMPEDVRHKEYRLRAAGMLADRAGYGPHSKLEVTARSDNGWLEYATPEELDYVAEMKVRCLSRMPVNQERELGPGEEESVA